MTYLNIDGMIEVFRTDVKDKNLAGQLIGQIHETFEHCQANFDLEDCDRILRVTGIKGEHEVFTIINLVQKSGCNAQILPDDYPLFDNAPLVAQKDGATIKA
jgi:hypothetical protein